MGVQVQIKSDGEMKWSMIAPLNCVFHISSPTQSHGSQELFKGKHRCPPPFPCLFLPSFSHSESNPRPWDGAFLHLLLLWRKMRTGQERKATFICLRVGQQELGQRVTWHPQSGRSAMRVAAQFSFPVLSVWDAAHRSMSYTFKSATPSWQAQKFAS